MKRTETVQDVIKVLLADRPSSDVATTGLPTPIGQEFSVLCA